MYKAKLQQLCQQRKWDLPQYSTSEEGQRHDVNYISTVTVNGRLFAAPNPCKSSKESHNDVAMIAFQHFSAETPITTAAPERPTETPITTTTPEPPTEPPITTATPEHPTESPITAMSEPPITETSEPPTESPIATTSEPPITITPEAPTETPITITTTDTPEPPTEIPVDALPPKRPSKHAFVFIPRDPNAPETPEEYQKRMEQEAMLAHLRTIQPLMPENYLPPWLRTPKNRRVPRAKPAEEHQSPEMEMTEEQPAPLETSPEEHQSHEVTMAQGCPDPLETPLEGDQSPEMKMAEGDPVHLATPQEVHPSPDVNMTEEEPVPLATPPETHPSPEVNMAEADPVPMATPLEDHRASLANQSSPGVKEDATVTGVPRLYKHQLRMYAQKRTLQQPTYFCEARGPPHNISYKCTVTIDGQTFESPNFCRTVKEAESAAARVALLAMPSTENQERDSDPKDSNQYKNHLQEFAHKEGYGPPVYETNKAGGNNPWFTSTVVIAGERFTGQPQNSKKQAERSAAKVAYTTLIERKGNQTSTSDVPAKPGSCVLLSQSTNTQQSTKRVNDEDHLFTYQPNARRVNEDHLFTYQPNARRVNEDYLFTYQPNARRVNEPLSFIHQQNARSAYERPSFTNQQNARRAYERLSFTHQQNATRANEGPSFTHQQSTTRTNEVPGFSHQQSACSVKMQE